MTTHTKTQQGPREYWCQNPEHGAIEAERDQWKHQYGASLQVIDRLNAEKAELLAACKFGLKQIETLAMRYMESERAALHWIAQNPAVSDFRAEIAKVE